MAQQLDLIWGFETLYLLIYELFKFGGWILAIFTENDHFLQNHLSYHEPSIMNRLELEGKVRPF